MPLINWDDVVGLFPQAGRGKGSDEVNSFHLAYAEAELNGALAGRFTTPFSSNNVTARELAINLTMTRLGQLKDKDAAALRKETLERIDRIRDGREAMMILVDGTLTPTYAGTVAWSSTKDYHPVFGVGDIVDMAVDSGQLIDEENARA